MQGGTPAENAKTTRSILGGDKGPRRDIVLLNAAAALWVVEKTPSIEAGLELAADSIDQGHALAKLDALAESTQNAAGRIDAARESAPPEDALMTILDKILAHKREEVSAAKLIQSADVLATRASSFAESTRGFRQALIETVGVSVIAEVKRQSPSKGLIRADFDPVEIALAYRAAGAACISVLTDTKFFGGSLAIFEQVRSAVDTPLIRKDFIIDAYQIDEARIYGADAILLIVSALADPELAALNRHALGLGLDVLVEVHNEAELDRALAIQANLIGVNNRDLRTFDVDLATTERLAARLPRDSDVILVAESGISNADDVARLERAGATGFLVGESLMRQPDPGKALEALRRRS